MTTTGDGQGLRGALEALAQEWERDWDASIATGVSSFGDASRKGAANRLRAVLADHPAPEPAAVTIPATGNGMKPHDNSDAFLEVSGGPGNTSDPEVHLLIRSNDGDFAQSWFRLTDVRQAVLLMEPAPTPSAWDLVKERDRAIVEQRPLVDSLIETRRQRDAAEARARVCREDAEQNAERAETAEARARRAEDALRELTEAASRLCVAVDIHPERLRPTLRREADKCRQALDWARAALSAADQTSDATPSDTGERGE